MIKRGCRTSGQAWKPARLCDSPLTQIGVVFLHL